MGFFCKLPDTHILYLFRLTNHIIVDFQIQIIQTLDCFRIEHRCPP